jgi:hypothetical protein
MKSKDKAMEHRYPSRRGKIKLEDWLMMKTLKQFLPTVKGWVFRQSVKYIAGASVAATAWMTAQGVPADSVPVILAGGTAVVTGVLEIVFSRIAAKLEEE